MAPACLNKSHPDFKKLSSKYGEKIAEVLVRDYSKNAKNLIDDFAYPKEKELISWIRQNKTRQMNVVKYVLGTRPETSSQVVKQLLKGVVSQYGDALFITTGRTNAGSLIITQEQLKTTFDPNYKIMQELARVFPERFRIKNTKTAHRKIVEILPAKENDPNPRILPQYRPDDEIREKYFMSGNVQTAESILRKIMDSSHPLSTVAARLIPYARVNNLTLSLVDVPSFEKPELRVKSALGYFDSGQNKIYIAQRGAVKNGLSEQLLMHEILHGFSWYAIRNDPQAARDLKEFYNRAVERLGKYNPETQTGLYATYTIDEFFVALFTDSEMIRALQKIEPLNNKYLSIYDQIVDYLLNLLGLNTTPSLYTQSYNAAMAILDSEMALMDMNESLDSIGDDVTLDDLYPPQDNVFLQKPSESLSVEPSSKTLTMIKDFIKKIGVDIKEMEKIVVNGKSFDANGVALVMQKLIAVVEGKEAQVLPEEAMHFAISIIKQTNPSLYKKLMSEINGYQTLKDVFATYGTDPAYQLNGKPDVIKLKEEAIGKVLADRIIKLSNESFETAERNVKTQSWWEAIKKWFKQLFKRSGFDEVAMDIISGKFQGNANDIREQQDSAFQSKSPQEIIYEKLKNISSQIEKKKDPSDPTGPEKYFFNGKMIKRRVTDLTKDFYERRRANNELIETEYDRAVADLKAEKGTKGHLDMEHAFDMFVDENGFLRSDAVIDHAIATDTHVSNINPADPSMYILLRNNLLERLRKFETENPGTRFLKEIVVYDPKRDIAGTIDFMAITPDGKVNILDWKFMGLNTEKYTEIPWYKVQSWRIQMNQYKLITQTNYGIAPEKFGQTRMIPILAEWTKGKPKEGILPTLNKIKIGDVEVKNISDEESFLLPVGLETERTGNKKLDSLIDRLNRAYERFAEKKVAPSERKEKNIQLNALFSAIMKLHMKQDIHPLLKQAVILHNQIKSLIDLHESKFKGVDPKTLTDEEIDSFIVSHENAKFAIDSYTDLYRELKSIIDPEDKELINKVREIAEKSKDYSIELDEIRDEFVKDIVAKREGFNFFGMAEKTVKGLARLFSSTATLQVKSIQLLYKKASKALGFAAMETQSESAQLASLRDEYQKWAKSIGLGAKDFFKPIKKASIVEVEVENEDGTKRKVKKYVNELIDQYKPEFYSQLKKFTKNKESADFKWIRDNIEVEEYRAHLAQVLEKEIKRIKERPRGDNPEENAREIEREISKAKRLYNLTKSDSPGWLLYDEVKKFPKKSVWESEEWKFLNKPENKPAKDFYDYIVKKNQEYAELGYIEKRTSRVFLPYVRKSLVERVVTGDNMELGREFLESISVDEGDIGYGQIDPMTGRPKRTIPRYFVEKLDENVSEDLFKTMSLYNEMALRYKYLTQIEAQLRAVAQVERNKKSIETSLFGRAVLKDGEPQLVDDNRANSDLYDAMMDAIIYGHKYVQSDVFDSTLGKIGDWGASINKALGMNVFPENLSERQLTVNKVVDNLNRSFQLTSLGLNVLSATSNFFGGNAQSLINAGTYFTKKDFIKAETELFINKFNKTAGNQTDSVQMFAGALEYFLPLTDNYNREIAKKLSVTSVTQESMQDFLMILMRNADFAVQTTNFYAFIKNSIVVDGQVVNAREYLRKQPDYSNKYAGTAADRKAFNDRFEEEVKRLVETQGVMKLGKIENGQFVLPGVERLSDSVIDVRRKVQQVTKDSLGNMSEDDVRLMNMNIITKSMMVFKNWIPRQVDVRLGEFKYNAASDAYEWGRMRTVMSFLSDGFSSATKALFDIIKGNDAGIEYLREAFEKRKQKHFEETGEILEMTEELFIDLVNKNIRALALDAVVTSTLIAMVFALKSVDFDDEDPATVNQYRFMVKALDKLKDELTYFWDPTSFGALLRGGLFPSLMLVENGTKAVKNFFFEMLAIGTGNEELEKDTKVIKYAMKTFPFTNQIAGYLPMFYPELAKDLGIRVQSNYGTR